MYGSSSFSNNHDKENKKFDGEDNHGLFCFF